jgi:cytochrome c-type biogenesis protein CcmH/NrfG
MNVAVAFVALVALVAIAAAGGAAPLLRRRTVPPLPVEAEPRTSGREARVAGGSRRGLPAWVAWTVVLGAVLAAVVPNLASSLHARTGAEAITGSAPETTAGSATASVPMLEAAVRADPTDVDARLALADRYLAQQRLREATDQYLAVLRLDPANAPARTSLGLVLYLSGRPADGLRAVRSAIEADPSYVRARLFEGVILYRGLHRPRPAALAVRAFLQKVDSGPEAAMARSLLADIEAAT